MSQMFSTGPPGSRGQNRTDHLAGQIAGGSLKVCRRRLGFGFQLSLGLRNLTAGSLAGSIRAPLRALRSIA